MGTIHISPCVTFAVCEFAWHYSGDYKNANLPTYCDLSADILLVPSWVSLESFAHMMSLVSLALKMLASTSHPLPTVGRFPL